MSLAGLLGRGFGPLSGGSTPTPPAVPTLAIADSANGTQAVATISASTTGSTNVVQVQSTSVIGAAWTNAGSRSGNGTVTLTLTRGYYWGRVASTKDGLTSYSNNVYFVVSAADDAILTTILEALQAKVQSLLLSGVAGSSIIIRKLPYDEDVTKPAVVICPYQESLSPNDGTNERDDINYRVSIVLMRASNRDLTSNMNWLALARERIRKSIHNQPLTAAGVDRWIATIEPGTIYIPQSFQQNIDCGYLIARVVSREDRSP
jgi:hypothetical protein